MQAEWQEILVMLRAYVPNLLGALAILVVGWLLALVVAALVRGVLRKTSLANRLAGWVVGEERARTLKLEVYTSKAVFYVMMLFVLVGFFQALGLTLVTEPLNRALGEVLVYLPNLFAAGLIFLVAWILARLARMLLTRVLTAARVDERLGSDRLGEAAAKIPLSKTLSDTVFWLILLLFLPAVLGVLALEGLLQPIQGMLSQVLEFLPNIFAAGLILLVGWFLARILQRIVTNLLDAVGVDRLSERAGLKSILGTQTISGLIGLVVHVLILIPVVVAALDALQLDAVSRPVSGMLNQILTILPSAFAAALVLIVAYVIGRLVAGLVTNLLTGFGFDVVLVRLGLSEEPVEGQRTPSAIVGFVVLLAVMLLACMEAFRVLGLTLLADVIAQFNVFASRVLLGLVIFALGLFLANLVYKRVHSTGVAHSKILALLSRISIVVVAAAMGLQQMGIGSEVIRLVLAVSLGAIALALGIAFGLGGRDSAGRLVEEWLQSLRARKQP